MTLGDRLAALSSAGLDATVVQRFSKEFAEIEAADFVKRFIVDCLDTEKIVVGHDINFGRGRAGSTGLLIEEGRRYGFDVEVIRPVEVEGTVVHSSSVRQAVASGDVAFAARLLGRPHFVRGRCVRGDARGRGLGFPTVNLRAKTRSTPCDGVYATIASIEGRSLDGVTSIGSKPTFGGEHTVIEAHLFDFDDDIYGASVTLRFIERLRDQRKFESPDALTSQVRKDVAESKRILSEFVTRSSVWQV
jgi:riboflavin kinase/FMN adenylyltransferase